MSLQSSSIKLSDKQIAEIAEELLMGKSTEEAAKNAFFWAMKYDQQLWLRVAVQVRDNMPKHIPLVKAHHKSQISKMVAMIIISLVVAVINVFTIMTGGFIFVAFFIIGVTTFVIGAAKYFQCAKARDKVHEAIDRWMAERNQSEKSL